MRRAGEATGAVFRGVLEAERAEYTECLRDHKQIQLGQKMESLPALLVWEIKQLDSKECLL